MVAFAPALLALLLAACFDWSRREIPDAIGPSQERDGVARRAISTTERTIVETLWKGFQRPRGLSSSEIANEFRVASREVKKLASPAVDFVGAVLDDQIARANLSAEHADGAKLVFAAAAFGELERWDDARVVEAANRVKAMVSREGDLVAICPIVAKPNGYTLPVAPFEAIIAIAQLMENAEVPLEPEFVRKLLNAFRTRRLVGGSVVGWSYEKNADAPQWWATALAAQALDAVARMLDQRINREVLRHFSAPGPLKVDLDGIFLPDYGLTKKGRDPGIGQILDEMYSHVLEGRRESSHRWSAVLYGPPGTGKTTLMEAVAKSSGGSLVQVTPSDIVVAGSEQMERRARVVFEALSMLTSAVILFDEFEPILGRRQRGGERPESMFPFLTPVRS